jgi:hypothetical protein
MSRTYVGVQGTRGAELEDSVVQSLQRWEEKGKVKRVLKVVVICVTVPCLCPDSEQGTNVAVDAYSAFETDTSINPPPPSLGSVLRNHGISRWVE